MFHGLGLLSFDCLARHLALGLLGRQFARGLLGIVAVNELHELLLTLLHSVKVALHVLDGLITNTQCYTRDCRFFSATSVQQLLDKSFLQ